MSKRHRRESVRLLPWVEASLAKRLAAYSAATGISASAVVRVALRQYLDQTSDATLLMRRLDRLGRAGARMHRDLEILSEAFALWTKLWFAHTPNVPEDAKPFARASAESRYRQFVDYLGRASSGRFVRGSTSFENKVKNFVDLRIAPMSLVAFHNAPFHQARMAFAMGCYYLSVATKSEGMRIKKMEGPVGSEKRVVLVGFAQDGVDDATIDAQSAA